MEAKDQGVGATIADIIVVGTLVVGPWVIGWRDARSAYDGETWHCVALPSADSLGLPLVRRVTDIGSYQRCTTCRAGSRDQSIERVTIDYRAKGRDIARWVLFIVGLSNLLLHSILDSGAWWGSIGSTILAVCSWVQRCMTSCQTWHAIASSSTWSSQRWGHKTKLEIVFLVLDFDI